MSYLVVEQDSLSKLVDEVDSWVSKGFTPCGGMTPHEGKFLQPMYQSPDAGMKAEPKKPSYTSPLHIDIKVDGWLMVADGLRDYIEIKYRFKGKFRTILIDRDILQLPHTQYRAVMMEHIHRHLWERAMREKW